MGNDIKTIQVGIAGATGPVGQKLIHLIANDLRYEICELAASDSRSGQRYADVTDYREKSALPSKIANMKLVEASSLKSPYILSCLPADSALTLEPLWIKRGQHVLSNASSFRMNPDVPLLIPEINSAHLSLIKKQKGPGYHVTNPNCSTVFVCMGVWPLLQLGSLRHLSVVTLQASSGAGYPGVPSLDLLGNTIPYISGEEEKIETETKKILGSPESPANFMVTAQVNRVPVAHGHTVVLQLEFVDSVQVEHAEKIFQDLSKSMPDSYQYYNGSMPAQPQPARVLSDLDMRAHVGKLRQGAEKNRLCLVVLGHNLVRGAAGAALANLNALTDLT
ncbi:MAG: aspartate-semialdehyde dehydrogenase [Candidatus Cloacimonetes bacterium]|nr:aspartate-semialdehyde dehydrogenase [Candidatus Cloacimonadota bacterium]